ncbi:MAG: hypothetical protein KF681_14555 [Bdellovibrionaceae bacterium]|nr:hypothetical protein [Pseudobdellovibrionaceae bacterium]
MKTALFLLIALVSFQASAWVSTPTIEKQHKFVYRMKSEVFEFASTSPSYEEAFDKAASACYRHFRDNTKARSGQAKLSEDQGLDIIDVCANPRSI